MDTIIRFLNPFTMIALGIFAGVHVVGRYKTPWRLYGLGAVTFIFSQVLHIPFNMWVLNPALQSLPDTGLSKIGVLFITGAALGLSAGVFEETSRAIMYAWAMKDERKWQDGLTAGAGHGGIEAILLGGLTLYGVIQIFTLTGVDLADVLPVDQVTLAEMQINAFWEMPWYVVMLGAAERAATICFHMAMSIVVLQAFTRKNFWWLGAAIGAHALLDAAAVITPNYVGVYWTEAVIVLFAVISVWIIIRLKPETQEVDELPSEPLPELVTIQPTAPSIDRIEESRYDG